MKKIISAIIIMAMISDKSIFARPVADTPKVTISKVSGISRNSDLPLIKKKLVNEEGIDEVTYAEAKSGPDTFTVACHSPFITAQKIRERIEAAPGCDNPNVFPYKISPLTTKKNKL